MNERGEPVGSAGNPLSLEQQKCLARLVHWALVEIRHLVQTPTPENLADIASLADAVHELPGLIVEYSFDADLCLWILEDLQTRRSSRSWFPYVGHLKEAFPEASLARLEQKQRETVEILEEMKRRREQGT